MSPETAPHKHYVAFRYVNPLTEQALQQVENDKAERVVLFSQYPQYSCATTGSSFNAIYTHYLKQSLPASVKWSLIDRWPTHPFLVKTVSERIVEELNQFPESIRSKVVIVFSAHSLPIKAVNRGDAYPSEVGATVQAVMKELGYRNPFILTWQSKVGAEVIRRAAAPNDHSLFIDALADLVSRHLRNNEPISPKFTLRCPHCVNPKCYDSKQWFQKLCSS
ncbi:lyase [Sarracenia purpurea var. burkii]